MATMASLVNLGSCVGVSNSGSFEVSSSLVKRGSLPRRVCQCSFVHLGGGRRWRYISVCRSSIVTSYIADQGDVVSLENTYKESKSRDGNFIMKPSPKPVLKFGLEGSSALWDASKFGVGSSNGKLDSVEERKKVIESLDEVLEKAERLETASARTQVDSRKDKRPVTNSSGNGRPLSFSSRGKPTTGKSVWRKGNPVSNAPNVVQRSPKVEKETQTTKEGVFDTRNRSPFRPPVPPPKAEVKLLARPSVAPPRA